MRVSTFVAKNSRGALMQVKDQLGEDAIILRNRRVGDRIEITATTDLNQPDWTPEPASGRGARRNDIRDQHLQNELTSLRDTLEQLLAKRSWQDSANVPAIQATVGQRLAALGLSKSLGGWISDNVRDDGPLEQQWDSSIQLLTSCLHLMEMDSVKKSKLVACVGATGSGKTTCVVKLARQAANEFGEQAVGVIALTNGASVEVGQLADHRVPAGIETRSATDKSSLSESIAALRGKERIFIDTSGLSFRDPDMAKQLEWLAEQIPPIRIMLVISAAAQMGTTRELLRRVGATRLDGAIITKVDEAVSLGGVIDTLIKRRLPLSLLVDNRDPDIVPLNTDPVVFVDRALALMNERQVSQSIGRSKYAPANAKVYA